MDPLLDQLTKGLGDTYRIERELSGGMSRVFVATELALGRRVVLKVLPPDLARDVSAERFKREISLAASLQHAHIVPLLTAGEAAAEHVYPGRGATRPSTVQSFACRMARSAAPPATTPPRMLKM